MYRTTKCSAIAKKLFANDLAYSNWYVWTVPPSAGTDATVFVETYRSLWRLEKITNNISNVSQCCFYNFTTLLASTGQKMLLAAPT